MPELKLLVKIDIIMHVTQMNGHYDIILGQDDVKVGKVKVDNMLFRLIGLERR